MRKSIPGYHDFSTGARGNSIDFLMQYKGMSFTEAVVALCPTAPFPAQKRRDSQQQEKRFSLPAKGSPPFRHAYNYLISRGIPDNVVCTLLQQQLLYEDALYANAVFVNPQRDYCEIRGTGEQKFHGCRKLSSNRFWYLMNTGSAPERAFICESAIDAVSLMVLMESAGFDDPAVFISIGGVANQQTIDRIKTRIPSWLAVDNDAAGQACRDRNTDMSWMIPQSKDWNEDLCAMKNGSAEKDESN